MSTKVNINALKPDLTFKSDLMLDENFILLPVAVPVTESLTKALNEWNFTEFRCNAEMSLGGDMGLPIQKVDKSKQEIAKIQAEEKVKNSLKHALEQANSGKFANTERSRLESVQAVYNEYMNYINSVYTDYATRKKINYQELSDTVKDLCIFIKDNKRYVLRITPSAEQRSKNFLVIHSMRSTVLAITLGLELHIAISKLIELGITSILHEIGMLRLPPQLYMSNRKLTNSERTQISTHPLLGCAILKELNFPLSIQLGVLEHHEKENGKGYPQHLTGEKISNYAKIIAVACSFEAITAPRLYKTARTTFDAMIEMLKNENQQYDPTVIKALLFSLSLFPIGAFVYLQNGKIAIVSDVSPNNPKNPIVQLINETEPDGSPKTVQTDNNLNKIVRVLTKEEQADVQKTLDLQRKITNQTAELTNALETAKANETKDEQGFSSVDLSEFN
ncbi:MAG: HD domain-containing phosphohydrolase [Treponema sp.]|jgi:HD-GYP domain-containing protein (c-di-GMP phosphodiesterase class II)|nr:HD domain-containing phosphohydrolase [Treponema sp.]